MRELETQFEEMAKRNAALTREHEALCAAHAKLQAEQEAWKAAEQSAKAKEVVPVAAGLESGDGEELHWRAEACLSQMLGEGAVGGDGGRLGGLVVKVVVCKRCFGTQVKAKCEG